MFTDLSVEQVELLFQHSSDFVFFVQKNEDDYDYLYINELALASVPNIRVGKSVKQCMDPKTARTIVKYYDEAIGKKEQTSFQDYTMFTSEIKKYETSVYPIFTEGKQYVIALTRQIAFERNIEDKYLFMRSVFFKTFLSTVLFSKDMDILEANPAFLNDFGIDLQLVQGKKLAELNFLNSENVRQLECYLQQTIKGSLAGSRPLQFVDQTGAARHFIASFSSLTDDDDEVVAIIVILQETTKLVEQREEIRHLSHAMDIMKRALNNAAEVSFTGVDGKIIDVNERFCQRTGLTAKELVGKTHNILSSGLHPTSFFDDLWLTISNGQIWRGEVCNRTIDGLTYWNDTTIIPLIDLEGNIFQYLGIYFDVTEKKDMMSKLQNTERTFKLITENSSDLIVVLNQKGQITYASPSYSGLLVVEDFVGQSYRSIVAEQSYRNWQQIIQSNCGSQGVIELALISHKNEIIWTECHYKVTSKNPIDGSYEITMISRVITDRKQYEKQLLFMAYHDSLTQLPNRRFLEKEFEHYKQFADLNDDAIAIVYIDGDNFKQVNDTYGHDIGDLFIQQFGQVLTRCVKSSDLVVRMGGDEFIVILNRLSKSREQFEQQIASFFDNVQSTLANGWTIESYVFRPTATMGVSAYPMDSQRLATLIDLADRMLYEGKLANRNRYQISSFESI